MQKKVKIAGTLLSTVVLAGGLAGCSSSTSSSSSGPMNLSMMYIIYKDPAVRTDAWKSIEQKLNINLNLIQVPSNNYNDKLSTTIASGSMPDTLLWTTFPDPLFNQYVQQGAFMPLDNYINQEPNLKKIPQPIWDMMKINGHIYGVPRPRALVRSAVIIRKDWLDKLGLPIPKTVDDFKKVAVAFAKNDPDGDGKPDTYGFVTGSKLDNLAPVFYALGAGNGWLKQSDGTLINSAITQGTKDTLQLVRDLYAQGVLNKDFPTMQGTQDWQDLESGKAGMIFGQTSDYSRYVQNLKKVDPNGQLIMIAPPVGPTGISGLEGTTGFFGDFVIPAKEDPAKAKKVMDLLDYEASDEGYHLSQYGVDGVDNTKNPDGSYQVNDKFIKENVGNVEPMNPYDPYSYVDKTAPTDVQKAQHDNLDLVKDKGIYNPAAAFTAPTYVQKGVDLDNMKWDYFIKIATGQLPMSAFDEFVSKWKAGGGDQITKETNDWYKTQGNK